MKKNGFYSSGEFARMANITLRTVRYYDKHQILKPSFLSDSGSRFYTDADFAKLQQILLLKYLGFTLNEIREMIVDDSTPQYMMDSLKIQLKLIRDRIEQMQLVETAIVETSTRLQSDTPVDWDQMLNLIHLTSMEKSLKNQYLNASNLSSRIKLHQLYSENKKGWFPWIFEHLELTNQAAVLEIGCGDGSFWLSNYDQIPEHSSIILSDISDGMLRDARRTIGPDDTRFTYENFDCHAIPYKDRSFDYVIANHVLFYCDNIPQVCEEISRILKPGGIFLCTTYGKNHLKEIRQLVHEFDERITLSAQNLYERFGFDNGAQILSTYFSDVSFLPYPDKLIVPDADPLISYILSCHGNQSQLLNNRYTDFRHFIQKQLTQPLEITKEAGLFLCQKNF